MSHSFYVKTSLGTTGPQPVGQTPGMYRKLCRLVITGRRSESLRALRLAHKPHTTQEFRPRSLNPVACGRQG